MSKKIELSTLSEIASDQAQMVREQAASLAQSVAEQATHHATSGAQMAKDAGHFISDGARSTVDGVNQASHRLTDDFVPTLRDVAVQAASAALELWQAARDRAEEAVDVANAEIREPASHALIHAERRARDASAKVAAQAGRAGDKAKDVTRQAAGSTVEAGKGTGAAIFWGAAAAGLVLYGLLDRGRREHVLKIATDSVTQIRELVRDFQGYDAEFQ